MPDLQDIYQEVILEHAKSPRNFRVLDDAEHKAEGFNPLCGDRCTVYIAMKGDVIDEVAFQGSGCAISRASASMMTQAIKGKTVEEAEELFREFQQVVTGQHGEELHAKLGKLDAFAGVAGFPSRVKCATLAWHTLKSALHGERQPVTTE
jgi:nitrogen fixation NifU-like protein